ncbi:cell division protein ZapE [Chitinimonas lacunae]|uniref:Cell division protein ZapE n=1 Tax=Chitinimonas lacunae TaxID=1963018 RepID=A0ABV8MI39_9NEIS
MSQHAFTAHIQPGTPPRHWYDEALCQPGFQRDPAQALAIDHLQRLYDELVEFKRKRDRLFGRSLLPSPPVPRGLYFWGGVGRGKSFLMDGFFACVPYKRKRRLHFHHFMREVHNGLRRHQREADPLAEVAAEIARAARLLCFDEFHVSDIADAMILGRLLERLFEAGVVLVATSNYEPDGLYPNGLQRANFLPTIALIKSRLDVVNIDGGNDYRMRTLENAGTYLCPITTDTDERLDRIFSQLATGPDLSSELIVEDRPLQARRHAAGVVWFDFPELCMGPRSQNDYLSLAQQYHSVIVSNLPRLASRQSAEARRLTWLVDVFYDHRVNLIISAEAPVEEIYTEGTFANEFFRTASRLTEMQSREYLALAHQSAPTKDPAMTMALT